MYGRYGTDTFNNAMYFLAIIIFVVQLFTHNFFLAIITDALIIYTLYRSFSKNIVKRSYENRVFIEKTTRPRRFIQVLKRNSQDKQNKYYLCPKCAQIVRVPRNRGSLEITCPSCGKVFTKRS